MADHGWRGWAAVVAMSTRGMAWLGDRESGGRGLGTGGVPQADRLRWNGSGGFGGRGTGGRVFVFFARRDPGDDACSGKQGGSVPHKRERERDLSPYKGFVPWEWGTSGGPGGGHLGDRPTCRPPDQEGSLLATSSGSAPHQAHPEARKGAWGPWPAAPPSSATRTRKAPWPPFHGCATTGPLQRLPGAAE